MSVSVSRKIGSALSAASATSSIADVFDGVLRLVVISAGADVAKTVTVTNSVAKGSETITWTSTGLTIAKAATSTLAEVVAGTVTGTAWGTLAALVAGTTVVAGVLSQTAIASLPNFVNGAKPSVCILDMDAMSSNARTIPTIYVANQSDASVAISIDTGTLLDGSDAAPISGATATVVAKGTARIAISTTERYVFVRGIGDGQVSLDLITL